MKRQGKNFDSDTKMTKLEVTVIPIDGDQPYTSKISVPSQVVGKLDSKGQALPYNIAKTQVGI